MFLAVFVEGRSVFQESLWFGLLVFIWRPFCCVSDGSSSTQPLSSADRKPWSGFGGKWEELLTLCLVRLRIKLGFFLLQRFSSISSVMESV